MDSFEASILSIPWGRFNVLWDFHISKISFMKGSFMEVLYARRLHAFLCSMVLGAYAWKGDRDCAIDCASTISSMIVLKTPRLLRMCVAWSSLIRAHLFWILWVLSSSQLCSPLYRCRAVLRLVKSWLITMELVRQFSSEVRHLYMHVSIILSHR